MPDNVLLALGSNLGPRQKTLEKAWREIGRIPSTETIRISRFYETAAIGGPVGQPDFLNAVGLVRTLLEPLELLRRLQEIENRNGRVRTEHWGPRTLDIDILLIDDLVLNDSDLIVPHPEMLRRSFVLEPASEIAPEMIHPVTGLSIVEHTLAAGFTPH